MIKRKQFLKSHPKNKDKLKSTNDVLKSAIFHRIYRMFNLHRIVLKTVSQQSFLKSGTSISIVDSNLNILNVTPRIILFLDSRKNSSHNMYNTSNIREMEINAAVSIFYGILYSVISNFVTQKVNKPSMLVQSRTQTLDYSNINFTRILKHVAILIL